MNIKSLCACLLLLLPGGCGTTYLTKGAAFTPQSTRQVAVLTPTDVYVVRYKVHGSGQWHEIPGSRRLVNTGQTVGFEKSPEGRVIAFTPFERFELDLPENWRYCCWYRRIRVGDQDAADVLIGSAAVLGAAATEAAVEKGLEELLPSEKKPGRK